MATDPWYVRELIADVPPEEYQAAVEDEDWDNDEGEEGDDAVDSQESDGDYSEDEESDSDGTDSDDEGSRVSLDSAVHSEASHAESTSPGYSPRTPSRSPPPVTDPGARRETASAAAVEAGKGQR